MSNTSNQTEPKISREKLVSQLVDAFRLYGYEGASLACLAKATGLGKTNLYHYFPGGKAEMAQAALAQVRTWLETSILKALDGSAEPAIKLQLMCDRVNVFFREGHNSCLWAVLACGQAGDDLFHAEIKGALSQWIQAIAMVLESSGLAAAVASDRAEDAVLRIQGALLLARAMGDPKPFQRTLQNLTTELLKRS
jgi:TetR/AcrR family transcriptional regulator, lmrAB and yxaGH operons repressor